MKNFIAFTILLFLIFPFLSCCERTDKVIETYNKVRQEAKQKAGETKEETEARLERKLQGALEKQKTPEEILEEQEKK